MGEAARRVGQLIQAAHPCEPMNAQGLGPLETLVTTVPEELVCAARIPFHSTGREPDFTSRDELAVLNVGQSDANLAITLSYPEREPVGPYKLVVKPGGHAESVSTT
jgi:Anabaena sensory rhodopsin transducer